ncbi:hypothetical protein NDU88_003173, partial [Pleurodeles waltl]
FLNVLQASDCRVGDRSHSLFLAAAPLAPLVPLYSKQEQLGECSTSPHRAPCAKASATAPAAPQHFSGSSLLACQGVAHHSPCGSLGCYDSATPAAAPIAPRAPCRASLRLIARSPSLPQNTQHKRSQRDRVIVSDPLLKKYPFYYWWCMKN